MCRKYFILIMYIISPILLKAQIYSGDNGLTVTGSGANKKVQQGGTLLQNTSLDLGSAFTYNIKKGAAYYLHFLNNGNIGFGTNAPTASFDVMGASRFRNSLTMNYGTVNRTAQIRDNGLYISMISDGTYPNSITGDANMTFSARSNFSFLSNSVERFTILENGNLGLGTTNPLAQFHSTGSVRLDGLLNDNAASRVVASDINGNLSWRDVTTLSGAASTITASNGLALSVNDVKLGGALIQKTDITGAFGTTFADTVASKRGFVVYHPTSSTSSYFSVGPGNYAASGFYDSTSVIVGWNSAKAMTSSTVRNNTVIGGRAGKDMTTGRINVLIGANAGQSITTGTFITALGVDALSQGSTMSFQTGIGYAALKSIKSGQDNFAIGDASLQNLDSSSNNVALGSYTGYAIKKGQGNTFVGSYVASFIKGGYFNTIIGERSFQSSSSSDTIRNNTAIGYKNFFNNLTGVGNIGIGYMAGYNELGNDKLYIENSNSSTPLIHGDFAADSLRFNAKVSIRDMDTIGTAFNVVTWDSSSGKLKKAPVPSGGGSSHWNTIGNDIVNANLGFVSIGSSANPAPADPQLKLAVNGNIYAQKLKITQQGWADYVFEPSYKLMPLSELEAYINKNKHLPDVPSAVEVEKRGLDLGDNQTILLKKIEELTLYVLALKKEIETLKVEKTIQPEKK